MRRMHVSILLTFTLASFGLAGIEIVDVAPASASAAAVVCAETGTQPPPATTSPLRFNAINPVRVLDTRSGTGVIQGGCAVEVDLSTALPPSARSAALNVTTVDGPSRGFVVAYPCDEIRPDTSNLNPQPFDPTANLVVSRLDPTRKVCLFTKNPTDLVVDVTGWFGGSGTLFHPITQARAIDTRIGLRPGGGTAKLAAETVMTIPLGGDWVPASATAVAVNVTSTESDLPGFVTVYPCGQSVPVSSNVNHLPRENRANEALVGLDGGGNLCLFSHVAIHVIVDVVGWFGPGDGGVPFTPGAGVRVVDSRIGTGWSGPIDLFETKVFSPAPSLALGADVALLNVVATDVLRDGFLTLYPCDQGRPETSSINFRPGADSTNLVAVALDAGGQVCVYAHGVTSVVIDTFGSFGAPGGLRSLTVQPSLDQPFSPDGHDYTVHCTASTNTLTFNAVGIAGASVSTTVPGGAMPTAGSSGSVSVPTDRAMVVTVSKGGSSEQYWVRCLPVDFPPLTVERPGQPTPGWYLVGLGFNAPAGTGKFAVILDERGVPVWYHRTSLPVIDVKRISSTSLAWTRLLGPAFGLDPTGGYEIHGLDGTVPVTTVRTEGIPTDHHDFQRLTNGNTVMVSYVPRSGVNASVLVKDTDGKAIGTNENVVDAVIQEIDPAGHSVWTWKSADHFDVAETTFPVRFDTNNDGTTDALDLVHLNSIDVADNGDLIVSFRHLDAVVRISRATQQTVWKLGGKPTTHDSGAMILSFANDPLGGFFRQHDARLLPNGHLTVFDNRTAKVGTASRGAEYTLDLSAHTATLVWEYRKTDGQNTFGLGSARRQPDGSTVIGWGGLQPLITEVDAGGDLTFQVTTLGMNYRSPKEPLGAFDRGTLRATAGT